VAEVQDTEQPAASPAEQQPAAAEVAPYGYMTDPGTGETRPRKRAGRAGVASLRAPAASTARTGLSPSLEELKANAATEGEQAREEDRVPGSARQRRGRQRGHSGVVKPPKEKEPAPPFRAGPIAAGMNKLYARIGKIVRAMDKDIGVAIISITKKENDDDTTVGEAWEELARTNPRVRAFLLRMIEGGAIMQLVYIHLPIAVAIVMKEGIRKRIPLVRLLDAFMDDDDGDQAEQGEGGAGGLGALLGGLTAGDMAQMGNLFNGMMTQAANGVPRSAAGAVRVPVAEGDGQAGGP
jgi:hypothetical protein